MRLAGGASEKGLPVCIEATKVDGLILAHTPFSHSYNYRSAVLHGYATLVEDQEEKLWAMQKITDSVIPNRWENARIPPTPAEMSSTNVLRVKVIDASAKVRLAGVMSEKKDLEDPEVTGKVWTGIVPVQELFGEPVAAYHNKVENVPEYLSSFVAGTNQDNVAYANAASEIAQQEPKK